MCKLHHIYAPAEEIPLAGEEGGEVGEEGGAGEEGEEDAEQAQQGGNTNHLRQTYSHCLDLCCLDS